MRESARRSLAALIALVSGAAACGPGEPETAGEPLRHVVLIVIDTLRADHVPKRRLERTRTPNLGALAERGQSFPTVSASFHQTSMSMGAMFTGLHPSIETGDPARVLPFNSQTWCGMARFANDDPDESCVPSSLSTLGERLQEAGWWTVGVVSNQFLYDPAGFSQGFQDWVEVGDRAPLVGRATRGPAQARQWRNVNQQVRLALDRAPGGRPIFLYVHYMDVHDWRILVGSYARSVGIVDRAIGELLGELGARGMLETTTVVLTSDHGERLGEEHGPEGEFPPYHGHWGDPSFEEILRVPLIVAPPFFEKPPAFFRTQDVFRLVLEIAGLPPERPAGTAPNELLVGERLYRTYRKGRWKVFFRREDGRAFFFDLMVDGRERKGHGPKHAARIEEFRERVDHLTTTLAATAPARTELSEDDRERLRALGYLEEIEGREQD